MTAATANGSKWASSATQLAREKNIAIVLVVAVIILAILEPRFLSAENLSAISRQIVPVGLIALGQFFVITSANIDLSLGYATCCGPSCSGSSSGRWTASSSGSSSSSSAPTPRGAIRFCINASLLAPPASTNQQRERS